jgi:hypothetical protein
MRQRVDELKAAAGKIARNSDAPSAADAHEIDAFFWTPVTFLPILKC